MVTDSLFLDWIRGRVDDVINVSGHRLSTAEIESALIQHPGVAETAVVGVSFSSLFDAFEYVTDCDFRYRMS